LNQFRFHFQNGTVLSVSIDPKILDEELRDDVEVLFIIVKNVLDESEYLTHAPHFELVLIDHVNELQKGRLQDDLVASLE
jgi:hypothetical protein